MTCQLPEENLENMKMLCQDILSSPRVMVKKIQGMVLNHYKGTVASA